MEWLEWRGQDTAVATYTNLWPPEAGLLLLFQSNINAPIKWAQPEEPLLGVAVSDPKGLTVQFSLFIFTFEYWSRNMVVNGEPVTGYWLEKTEWKI